MSGFPLPSSCRICSKLEIDCSFDYRDISCLQSSMFSPLFLQRSTNATLCNHFEESKGLIELLTGPEDRIIASLPSQNFVEGICIKCSF